MHRVLVVALPGTESARAPDGATDIVVVVPALASTVEALTGAVDDRRADAGGDGKPAGRAAAERARRDRRGRSGLAVEDALRTFGADEIVVAGDDALVAAIRER